MSHVNVESQTIAPEMARAATLNSSENNGQNIMQVCPIQKGNPVITFEIDLYNGFVICGLASGAVDCWVLPSALGGPNTQYAELCCYIVMLLCLLYSCYCWCCNFYFV